MYRELSAQNGGHPHPWQLATSRHVAKTHSMKAINMCLLFCSILGGLVGLGYLLFDPIVKHIVLNKLILRNSSDFAQIWENPPITPHLKVYFFNLTNPEQVFNGTAKPKLAEVGPYTYQQKWIKENVQWHDNGTMSYSTRKIFTFMPDLSVGHHSTDLITTINVPVASAYYQMRKADFFTAWGLDTFISSLEYNLWVTKSVEELVWGYDEPLFELAKLTLPNPPSMTQFGFFTGKNDSAVLPTYTMYTGEGNPYNLSKISLFNGRQHLDFWKTDQCNEVQGSDGATFNPYIQKMDTLWFFNDQLCRSIPLVFKEKIYSRNLPGMRFVPRDDVFMSPQTHPDNDCFCVDKDLCSMIGDGFYPVSACQFDAPIVLSWPHFMHANRSFIEAVEGLKNPRQDEHGFWFDVQPTTGTTLSAKARIQINIAIKNMDTFDALSKVPDTIMPILWFEEGLDQLGDNLINILATAVHSPPLYKNYIFCTFLGLFLSTLIISAVALCRALLNRRRAKQLRICREKAKHILKPHGDDTSAEQPMLPDSGMSSAASASRATTANHSRNTSTGSTSINPASSNDKKSQQQSTVVTMSPEVAVATAAKLQRILDNEKDPVPVGVNQVEPPGPNSSALSLPLQQCQGYKVKERPPPMCHGAPNQLITAISNRIIARVPITEEDTVLDKSTEKRDHDLDATGHAMIGAQTSKVVVSYR